MTMTQKSRARWNAIATGVIFGAACTGIIAALTLLVLALPALAAGLLYLGMMLLGGDATQVHGIEWAAFGSAAAPQIAILAACTAAVLAFGRVASRTAHIRN